MFSRSFIVSIVFLGIFYAQIAMAYRSEGVERVKNPTTLMKQADKEGLVISDQERAVKKDLLKLKRTNPKEFEKKLGQGLENPTLYQGYLLEVKEGLQKVEQAKKISKIYLYKKIQSDWDIIKTSALNTRVDTTFKSYRAKLKSDLEGLYYIKYDEGYVFQVGQWGYVTVSKSLKNIKWRVEFNSKYDKNQLEEGAEDIQIQEDSSLSESLGEEAIEPPPPEEKSQFE
jgi:hypothetical protein